MSDLEAYEESTPKNTEEEDVSSFLIKLKAAIASSGIDKLEQANEEIKKAQEELDKQEGKYLAVKVGQEGSEDADDPDCKSIHVKNVDYQAEPKELQEHFSSCGAISRVTILCNKQTGHPLG